MLNRTTPHNIVLAFTIQCEISKQIQENIDIAQIIMFVLAHRKFSVEKNDLMVSAHFNNIWFIIHRIAKNANIAQY